MGIVVNVADVASAVAIDRPAVRRTSRLLCVPVLAGALGLPSGCGRPADHLDRSGDTACGYGYVAGYAQLHSKPVAEDKALVDAFLAARRSRNPVMSAWVADQRVIGTARRKTQAQADTAVLRLLEVCRGLRWRPGGSPSPRSR